MLELEVDLFLGFGVGSDLLKSLVGRDIFLEIL